MIHHSPKRTRANRNFNLPIRACIFDLDGVLVDTAIYHFRAWSRLALNLGIELRPEDNERLKGVSRMACVEILLSLAGKTSSEAEKVEFAERKNGWYREYIASIDESAVLPGVRDFVVGCRTIGLPVAVASASKNAMDILAATRLLPLFDAVVDGNAVSKAKPDPEVFLAAARKLGKKGEDCLVFEDAAAGIEGAIAALMRVVGIGDPEKLVRADIVMPGFAGQSPTELLAMLGRR